MPLIIPCFDLARPATFCNKICSLEREVCIFEGKNSQIPCIFPCLPGIQPEKG
jgi:hypothetical protein